MANELRLALAKRPAIDEAQIILRRFIGESWSRIPPERQSVEPLVLSLHGLIDSLLREEHATAIAEHQRKERPIVVFQQDINAEPFHDAAWELVRRGLLTPVLRTHPTGAPGLAYEFRLTISGQQWAAGVSDVDVVPNEYGRFLARLGKHNSRFGPIYASRSREALDCYRFHAYIAACTMCGAAAEAVVLALASAAVGSEEVALAEYRTKDGAKRLMARLTHGRNSQLQQQLSPAFELLRYWRNDASHAFDGSFDEDLSFTALLLLLRLAHFADTRWAELSARPSAP